jgi:hypothetical protein
MRRELIPWLVMLALGVAVWLSSSVVRTHPMFAGVVVLAAILFSAAFVVARLKSK